MQIFDKIQPLKKKFMQKVWMHYLALGKPRQKDRQREYKLDEK
jgi:hypothetical protein